MGVLGVICGTKVMKCETNLKKQVGKVGGEELIEKVNEICATGI